MFSKKKLIAPAIFLMLARMLAACGTETPTNTPVPPEATATTAPPAAAATNTTAPAAPATNTTAPSAGGGTFKWRAYAEPETFDPALMQENLSIDIGQNI